MLKHFVNTLTIPLSILNKGKTKYLIVRELLTEL